MFVPRPIVGLHQPMSDCRSTVGMDARQKPLEAFVAVAAAVETRCAVEGPKGTPCAQVSE
jgi:hypothetical protein